MKNLVEMIQNTIPYDSFSDTELDHLLPGSPHSRYGLIKRAVAGGNFIRLRRGLYCLGEKFRRQSLNLFVLAQKIYGPSYISFQSSLSYHEWIPEAVYTVTSSCLNRSKTYQTPLGIFSYVSIPAKIFLAGVDLVRTEKETFLMASPLRALADIVYAGKKNWKGIHPLIHDLRIEEESLSAIKLTDVEVMLKACPHRRVQNFLLGIKKDLLTGP